MIKGIFIFTLELFPSSVSYLKFRFMKANDEYNDEQMKSEAKK